MVTEINFPLIYEKRINNNDIMCEREDYSIFVLISDTDTPSLDEFKNYIMSYVDSNGKTSHERIQKTKDTLLYSLAVSESKRIEYLKNKEAEKQVEEVQRNWENTQVKRYIKLIRGENNKEESQE